jgi:hypothetical protein
MCLASKSMDVSAGSELWKCMLLAGTVEHLQCLPIEVLMVMDEVEHHSQDLSFWSEMCKSD